MSHLKILAIASKGGHWEQLMLLRPAFAGASLSFACTDPLQNVGFQEGQFYSIDDYSRTTPVQMVKGGFNLFRLIWKLRPDFIISTGAAPGLIALLFGRFLGAKTIWIDSIANSQKMSLSGTLACKFCDVTLTQWEHLANKNGCSYWGSVI